MNKKGEAYGFERKLKKKVLVFTDFEKNILLWSGAQDVISSTLTMTIKLPKMCKPTQCVFFLWFWTKEATATDGRGEVPEMLAVIIYEDSDPGHPAPVFPRPLRSLPALHLEPLLPFLFDWSRLGFPHLHPLLGSHVWPLQA